MHKFKTRKVRPNYSFDHTIKRIAQVACATDYSKHPLESDECQVPWLKENSTWVLNSGNDWFLTLEKEDDEFRYWELRYRYTTEERSKRLEALCQFLEWDLGDI